jgi:hypothetical protein
MKVVVHFTDMGDGREGNGFHRDGLVELGFTFPLQVACVNAVGHGLAKVRRLRHV